MKTSILSFVLVLVFGFCATSFVQAQVTYTSKPNVGTSSWSWSDPNAWTISGNPRGFMVPSNDMANNGRDNNNNIVIINSKVVLDTDYNVTNDGKLVINSGASLIEDQAGRTIFFGEQTGRDMLRLQLDGMLRVTTARFYKADANLGAGAVLQTSCNLALGNQSDLDIAAGAVLDIDGNLLVRQGNPSIGSLSGGGMLTISGCVMTQGNGSIKGLFGPNLSVCIQGGNTNCGIDPVEDRGLTCNPRALDEITINGCRTPLPVELVSFTGRYTNKQVQLNWATASEKNSATFAVERSIDGKSFETLTTLKAAGESSSRRTYTATDRMPNAGLNYYRLKQTDFDGTFAYSPVVSVQAEGVAAQQMAVYGRTGSLNIEMTSAAMYKAIRVMDTMGRLLYTETLPEGTTGAVVRQIPVRQSGNGIYIVQAVTTGGVMSQKFMLAAE